MSDRIFQNVIHQMSEAIDRTIGVIDENSKIIACNQVNFIGDNFKSVNCKSLLVSNIIVTDNYTFKLISNNLSPEYAVFVSGTDDMAQKYVTILAIALGNAKNYSDEKYNKKNFVKNVILDNVLPGDIYLKSKELKFNNDVSRVCMLIKVLNKSDVSVYDIIKELFPEKNKDFVINISEDDIVLVKETHADTSHDDIKKLAASIVDTLNGEYYTKVVIGLGSVVTGIRELARSFKEAQLAIEVGKVFGSEKSIISYSNLGISRLVYQLPTTLCDTFLHEIFKKGSVDAIDQETLFTIQKFFENNLNVSETSRKLFVHRNTLVYRLDKIKKLTGLDLREFEDAIVFKIALMVKQYLTKNPIKY